MLGDEENYAYHSINDFLSCAIIRTIATTTFARSMTTSSSTCRTHSTNATHTATATNTTSSTNTTHTTSTAITQTTTTTSINKGNKENQKVFALYS